jgi:hypothetical protein
VPDEGVVKRVYARDHLSVPRTEAALKNSEKSAQSNLQSKYTRTCEHISAKLKKKLIIL